MTAQKTTLKEYIEWTNLRWHNAPDRFKPRVLLVGDSIVGGHADMVFKLVQDRLCIDYLATSKCVSDKDYMAELDYMLSQNNYTVIIFNNGLHGFDIDDAVYAENLREALAYLKTKTELLVWRNSTPIRTVGDLNRFEDARNPRVIKRNENAVKIASELYLPVIDLYTPMAGNPDLFSEDAIHFNLNGCKFQAENIAAFLKQQKCYSTIQHSLTSADS